MLNLQQATAVIERELPLGTIKKIVEYQGLYLFQVINDDPFEGEWDPFYSVDRTTGKFSDFSIITDGNPTELSALFEAAKEV